MKNKIKILYQDEDLLMVNKAAGTLSIPDRFVPQKKNLLHVLEQQFEKVWVVHRLDKDTSGIICFALNAAAHKILSQQFENREVQKIYWALVEGRLSPETGKIERGILPHPRIAGKMMPSVKGKAALTLFKSLDNYRNYTWVEAEIKTGRTHQIRVHFSSIGHPLAVDPLYGKKEAFYVSFLKNKKYRLGKNQEERPLISRLSLHAAQLSLLHPRSKEKITIEAPLPKDLRALRNQLDKWGR